MSDSFLSSIAVPAFRRPRISRKRPGVTPSIDSRNAWLRSDPEKRIALIWGMAFIRIGAGKVVGLATAAFRLIRHAGMRNRALISYLLWPGLFGGSLAATYFAVQAQYNPYAVVICVYLGLAGAIALLERVMPHESEWNNRDGQTGNDLGHTLLGSALAGQVAQAVTVAATLSVGMYLSRWFDPVIWPSNWPMVAQVVLALVVGEIGAYSAHRLAHEVPLLWRFHALHHSAPRLYFLNTGRFHPVDTIKSVILSYPLLILAGAGEQVLLWDTICFQYIGILSHCNIRMRFGWLNYIFNTPGVHRWHHSRDIRESNKNYGENLMIFDVLFGTHFNPDRRPPVNVGMNDPMPRGFVAQVIWPFLSTRGRRHPRYVSAGWVDQDAGVEDAGGV